MESWNSGCFKTHHDHNIGALNKWLLFFPAYPINSHDESPLEEAHAPAILLWTPPLWFRGSRFLLSRGSSGSFVKHLGENGWGWGGADPLGTPKITPQQDKASPQCETVPQLLCENKSFPFYFSFSAPESPHIPLPRLCRAALLARLTPVNTSGSQTLEGLSFGST